MKLFLGIIIGALVASGVFYYLTKIEKEKKTSEFIVSVDSTKAVNMNLNKPSEDTASRNIIITKDALIIIAAANNELYYYHGKDCSKLERTNFKDLRDILAADKKKINANDLMIIVKATPEATYKNTIDILDEVAINKIPRGHYMEIEINTREINCLNNYKKN